MEEKSALVKRLHENGSKSEEFKKIKMEKKFCNFWIEKKKRNCLTKAVESYFLCQAHLDRTSNPAKYLTEINKNDIESGYKKVRCGFWVERKMRYCKCIPLKGAIFCPEHTADQPDSSKKRIPCPYDPKHTCYESQLEKHLSKCNSRPGFKPVFYEENVNSGLLREDSSKKSIGDMEVDGLLTTINIVSSLHSKIEVRDKISKHVVVEESLKEEQHRANKHLKQISSLLGNMDEMFLLQPSITYVEFGAGRGGLSHWIQKANPSEDCSFVLVDRSSVRYKKDNYHKGPEQGPSFERIKIDIQHLKLGDVASLKEKKLVCVGKHLCGDATDLMLRCLVNSMSTLEMKGVVLALCCHHRCTWGTYVGREWLLENMVKEEDFERMVKMSAWAVCGTKHYQVSEAESELKEDTTYTHARYGSLTPQQRQEVGFKCKRVIDTGRLNYLERNKFKGQLIEYVSLKTTLENVALTALKL